MLDFTDAYLDSIAIHYIGNKNEDEGLTLSKDLIIIKDDDELESLKKYFLSSFRTNIFYNFSDEEEKSEIVFNSISKIFDDPENILDESITIARHLYEKSNHPKIKGGDLFVVYFNDCVVDDEQCDAIGLFKSENKNRYLKVHPKENNFSLSFEDGINLQKIDKGCLIFNTEKDMGYKVCLVDNISKAEEARYWKEEFLSLKAREDNFYYTVNQLKMCKGFVEEAFSDKEEFSKSDRIDLLNRSVEYFNNNDTFSKQSFDEEVMEKPELINAFEEYKKQYEIANDMHTEEEFEISKPAFRGTKKHLRSVLKLDKNFHVYIHGKREYIEKGYDEDKGLHYYQLFFEEES